ncbi:MULTISPECIES: type II secretion system protein GspL [unclassified Xanthomonas]|uniref:type II secretion system protein GspL n=1 Tax=unclassified Xanthomonas TaxID=2643310 RepID=UPI00161D34F6|nr:MULTISPECIES: type II secretion system protein GspL [unclassified Xanthomonas]MBB4131217.1 general secretion pathway protein L [Xanthomonas sp. 3075]MBB5864731.1 general secretion pathway protein L [Xanthomonas sp. 3058]
MSTTLVLLPADAATEAIAVRVDAQGRVLAQGTGGALHDPAARTVLVVPGTHVHLRWMRLPGRSVAQSVAAARLQLAEHLATDAQTVHVVIADSADADGMRLVAAVEAEVMQQWLERAARLGVVPDAVVPECLLLPGADADHAATLVQWDGRWLMHGAQMACSLEPPLAELLLATQPVTPSLPPNPDPQHAIALFARHAAVVPINLRQHRFAAPTQARAGLTTRKLAILLVVLAISPLLLLLAQTVRYETGAQLLQRRSAAMPGVQPPADPHAAATPQHGAATASTFATQLATLFAAVEAVPGAELDTLAYRHAGPLRVTLVHDDAAQLQQLSAQLSRAGWQLQAGASQAQDDRVRTPLQLEPPR